jgi:hypothetical protein
MIESLFQLGLAFFGLSYKTAPQARNAVFTQIHEIVFHGKGGYDWNTIYNMPIWLRRFTFSKIQDFYTEEKNSYENKGSDGKKTVINSDGKIKLPEHLKTPDSFKSPSNSTGPKKPVKYT